MTEKEEKLFIVAKHKKLSDVLNMYSRLTLAKVGTHHPIIHFLHYPRYTFKWSGYWNMKTKNAVHFIFPWKVWYLNSFAHMFIIISNICIYTLHIYIAKYYLITYKCNTLDWSLINIILHYTTYTYIIQSNTFTVYTVYTVMYTYTSQINTLYESLINTILHLYTNNYTLNWNYIYTYTFMFTYISQRNTLDWSLINIIFIQLGEQ